MDTNGDPDSNPRVARTKARVLAAVRELLASQGLTGLTMDGVARQAGVSRTTMYRHWDGVPQLLSDAAGAVAGDLTTIPAGGSLRADLLTVYRELALRLTGRAGGSELASLLAAAEHDPAVGDRYRAFVFEQRRQVQRLLAAAITRDELPPGTDLELAVDLLAAPMFYRRLVMGEPSDRPGYVESVVDTVLAGIGHRPSRRPPIAA